MSSRIISKAIDLTNQSPDITNKYITEITANNGIRIHPVNTENNSIVINGSGMEVFKGGTGSTYSVAQYGDTVRIGKESSGHAILDSEGMDIYQNGISVAHYGEYTKIGKDGDANTRISPNEVIISASENISALRITPDGNEQSISNIEFISSWLEPGESSTHTFPSDASSGSYITYRIRHYGTTDIFDITDVQKGTSTSIKHITSPFEFDYSASTTSITITNTGSSGRVIVDRAMYNTTSISPLIEVGGVLTAGNSPAVNAYTLLAVGSGTNSFSVDMIGNMYCRNYRINDFVVEQGASPGTVDWDYRKWYNGFAECWGTVDVPSATYAANGGYKAFTFDFPSGLFVSNPRCLQVSGGISGVVHTDIGFTAVNSPNSGQAYLINRGSSAVTATGKAYVYAVGSWRLY